MPRAIDLHVHLPTDEWLENAIGPHLEATERYFRKSPKRRNLDQVAEEYRERDVLGVVLDWDDRSVTGRPWLGNDFLASLPERYPGALMGFGSVDPYADDALDEMKRAAGLGLTGLKFHPTMQAFHPGDERFYPLWSAAQDLGLVLLFHTG
ncbi:MAG TPA: amidohydrolase family protein, partial [Actinomycetota bacterium]|nr:amidohydrolase family protein [Actinomycetota bacterium]